MLSTTLYMACTSMDTIMGHAMVSSSLFTGITPILFSSGCIRSLKCFTPKKDSGTRPESCTLLLYNTTFSGSFSSPSPQFGR